MYPHERSLVENLAGKPFILLGINSDDDREALKETLTTENINWRSWWDAGSIDGPIHSQWQVTQRPAIYLLDGKGVIRHKNIEEMDLDKAIETLLKELPSESG